jgi:GntR family transcriptional regulator of vanillate catabolism
MERRIPAWTRLGQHPGNGPAREFKPGERIFEIPLAERLGVSRTPIRLALERLAQDGLLETLESGVSFTVREFTPRDIRDAIL